MGIYHQGYRKRESSKSIKLLSFPHFFANIKNNFRNIDRSIYPSIKSYSEDELYDFGNWLSPGGYLMLHLISQNLNIKKGSRILDLGCGNGQSSVFFAKEYDADVVAIDLWIDSETRDKRAKEKGVASKINNITADVCEGLNEVNGTFDYIISVQAFHCFGSKDGLLSSLEKYLTSGSKIGIIQSTFSKEGKLPDVFLKSNGWETDYSTYFYPNWWKKHFKNNGYQIIDCFELLQGKQIWEDNILYYGNKTNWTESYFKSHGWLMEQVLYDVKGFYLTHFLLTAINKV